jgi:hypothetical protein
MKQTDTIVDSARRPRFLKDVAALTKSGLRFDPALREFLDEFYVADAALRASALEDEPIWLSPIHDAYLAAVAEHLALSYGLDIPAWTQSPRRVLERPFFAGGLEGLKPLLLVESPLAFRKRNIFVSHDALDRPRQHLTMQPHDEISFV